MKKIVVVTLVILIGLTGCNKKNGPIDIANSYFQEVYNSNTYLDVLEDEDFNLEEKIQAVISMPFSSEDAIKYLLDNSMTLLEPIYLNGYRLEVKNVEYKLLEKSEDEDVYYSYLMIVEIIDPEGNATSEEFSGELNLTLIDEQWKIYRDQLASINWDSIDILE
ncbi:hypothetical protein RJG79_00945 [Mycoplasmatota bacterium WC44]